MKNILLEELARRRTRNSSYSLRAFARDLKIGVTTLSDVLSDKRSLSKSNLEKVIERLAISPLQGQQLRDDHKQTAQRPPEVDDRILLDEDTFRLISDWQYLAILNLAEIKANKAQPEWIAERLGLSLDITTEALNRLFRMQLLKKVRGQLVRTEQRLTTSKEIPSAAIRKHHVQNLRLAEESLHRDPVHTREFGSVTMAVNVENLPQAKALLLKTRKKIAEMLDVGPTSEVYTLSFQLFPLTKLKNPSEDPK